MKKTGIERLNDTASQDGATKLRAVVVEAFQSSSTPLYVPNEGNAGDALIAAGMWSFFDSLSLSPRISRLDELKEGDIAFYSGGGNLVDGYKECANFLERCLDVGVRKAIVFPHTVRGNEGLLSRLDSRFTIVCRDLVSLSWVSKFSNCGLNYFFAPDMAFFLDVPGLESRVKKPAAMGDFFSYLVCSPKQLVKYSLWRVKKTAVVPDAHGHLKVFRVDIEATDAQKGPASYDLSNLYGSKYRSREESEFITHGFLKTLSRADSIETNRLHVAVGGALINKKVVLYDNSYGKNSAIYDATLKYFPNVESRFLD